MPYIITSCHRLGTAGRNLLSISIGIIPFSSPPTMALFSLYYPFFISPSLQPPSTSTTVPLPFSYFTSYPHFIFSFPPSFISVPHHLHHLPLTVQILNTDSLLELEMLSATANYDLFSSALDSLLGVNDDDCDNVVDPGSATTIDSATH